MSPRVLIWDLENSPALGYFWGKTYNTNIIRIVEPSSVMCFGARWHGEKKTEFWSDFHDGHDAMVARAWELLDEADALVSYNGRRHDTPHTLTEIVMAGASPPSPFKEIDLYQVTRGKFKFQSNKLDFVSQQLGIGEKIRHEGLDLWLACMAGDPAAWRRFKRYQLQDVNLTEHLYNRLLPWIPRSMHPNLNLFADRPVCPKCGAGAEWMERRGTAKTLVAAYPKFRCRQCGGWSQDKKAVDSVDLRGAA